ncbi:hypothetical protein CYY_004452 [Polysphondylium violaceum]|uniref:WD40 repeat-containing protein n=1 Tax=Polysphondylium violaceum TaxID=133409 RepID=A0A8J4PV53_9MYCE|nr:hypothetical protein CYY_004452 [Polysphondylium violaceum]
MKNNNNKNNNTSNSNSKRVMKNNSNDSNRNNNNNNSNKNLNSNNNSNKKKTNNNNNNNKYKSQKDKLKTSPNQTILTPPLISQLNITSPPSLTNSGRVTPPLFQLNNNNDSLNNNNNSRNNSNNMTNTSTTTTTNTTPQQFPGYYYDPEKNRYFKLTNDIKQRLANERKLEKEKLEVETKMNQTTNNNLVYNDKSTIFTCDTIDKLLFQREFNIDKHSNNPYHLQRYASDLMLHNNISLCQSFEICGLKKLDQCLPLYDILARSDGPSTTSHGIVFTRNDTIGYVVFKQNNSRRAVKNRIVNTNYDYNQNSNNDDDGDDDDDDDHSAFTLSSIAHFFAKSHICSISSSPFDSKLVAAATYGGEVSVFSIIPYQDEMITESMKKVIDSGLYSCCWHPKKNQVAIGTLGNSVMWDIESSVLSNTWLSRSDILCQDFNNSGELLFNGSRDGYIRPIDQRCKARALSSLFLNQTSSVHDLKCLDDDNYVLAASLNSTICKWDLRVGKQVVVYPHHKNNVNISRMTLSSDKRYICAPGDDRFVRIWNCSDGSLVKTLGPFPEPIKMVQFIDNWSQTCGHSSIYFPTLLVSTNKGLEIYSYPGGG